MRPDWPDIPYPAWRDTCSALHLYAQIAGKYRLAHTRWINHSWHATLYVTARGLSTSIVPDGPGGIEVLFDLVDHRVVCSASDGRIAAFPLRRGSVAGFHSMFRQSIGLVGGTPSFDGAPNELPNAVPFEDDEVPRPYDADAVTRFHRALVHVDRVLKQFRTGFLGKVSPVHLFWGSFDLAVTRFSGRRAPLHPGGIKGLPDDVTREAYSHEVSSAGFWPGGGGIDFPAFYSYAYPKPSGFSHARVLPASAYFDESLGEFLLPYEDVQRATDPEQALLSFLESTYEAAATHAAWERAELECPIGDFGRARRI